MSTDDKNRTFADLCPNDPPSAAELENGIRVLLTDMYHEEAECWTCSGENTYEEAGHFRGLDILRRYIGAPIDEWTDVLDERVRDDA